MKNFWKATLAVTFGTFAIGVVAQDQPAPQPKPATIQQRKDNQQQRIGQGVENGSLTSAEATRLEHKEAALNREQKQMRSDGTLSAEERARLQKQQNRLSNQIYNQKHDAQVQNTNPQTEVGKRQRAQQQRIGEGIENGSLNAREAGRLEGQQTRLNREIRHDRRDGGGMTNAERAKINRQQNVESKRIYHQKHDGQTRHR